jgi:predicted transcriptional regulator
MTKKLVEIASEIVNVQASGTSMSAEEISSALREVFGTLYELQRAESGEMDLVAIQEPEAAQALKPEDSIQNDKVICLECGAEMKQLTKLHLVSHGMTAKEYKKKYGFTMGTPLAAKSLTRARSRAAKKRGVPENLKKYMDAKRQAKTEEVKPAAEVVKPAATLPVSETPKISRAKRIKSRFSPRTVE